MYMCLRLFMCVCVFLCVFRVSFFIIAMGFVGHKINGMEWESLLNAVTGGSNYLFIAALLTFYSFIPDRKFCQWSCTRERHYSTNNLAIANRSCISSAHAV